MHLLSRLLLLFLPIALFSCQLFRPSGQTVIDLDLEPLPYQLASTPDDTTAKASLQEVLLARLENFGVSPNWVEMNLSSDRLTVTIAGHYDKERLASLLTNRGALVFSETYDSEEVLGVLHEVNEGLKDTNQMQSQLAKLDSLEALLEVPDTAAYTFMNDMKADEAKEKSRKRIEEDRNRLKNPLFSILSIPRTSEGHYSPLIGYSMAEDTAAVTAILREELGKYGEVDNFAYAWTSSALQGTESIFSLIALKKAVDKLPFTEENILTAGLEIDERGNQAILLRMTEVGATKWAEMTKANIGKSIAIVIDGQVISYPTVQGVIRGGRSQITGNFTKEEASDLSNILNSKRLPVKVSVSKMEMTEKK